VLSVPDPTGALAERLRRESHILARLEHPNIVPVHDVGTLPDGRVFYAMKRVHGQRLDEWLQTARPARPAALRLFIKICEAVAFAHARRVIHRDLKPQNVMVGSFGEALVMDWGLARILGGHALEEEHLGEPLGDEPIGARTAWGAVLGTPAYMSPEQAQGATRSLDQRADVYALGAILHFLAVGRPPFEGPSAADILRQVLHDPPASLRRWDPSLPKPLEALCLKAMSRRPEDRYATAEEFAADVGRFLDGLPVTAYKEGALEVAQRLLTRYRTVVALVMAYLVMRLVLLLVLRH
jgi:serine/threonine protein kinase